MTDLDYDLVLDAVATAMEAVQQPVPAPAGDAMNRMPPLPRPANDNDGPWPHLDFPEGWTASS